MSDLSVPPQFLEDNENSTKQEFPNFLSGLSASDLAWLRHAKAARPFIEIAESTVRRIYEPTEHLSIGEFTFACTSDGVLINPTDYTEYFATRHFLDRRWEAAVDMALGMSVHLLPLISELDGTFLDDALEARDFVDNNCWSVIIEHDMLTHCIALKTIIGSNDAILLPNSVFLFINATVEFYERERAASEARSMPDPGYVYLVQSPTGFYKIGRTKDPTNRAKTFSVKLPFEVKMLHIIPCADYKLAERDLHERYSRWRVDGEWFNLPAEAVLEIKHIETM